MYGRQPNPDVTAYSCQRPKMEEEKCIPVIDLQLFPDEVEYKKLRRACEEWGCFRIINHLIPLELLKEMKVVVRSLFDLPMEIKKRNTDVMPGSGYMAPSETNPLYEAFGLYDVRSSQAVQTFCSQLGATPEQRETLLVYGKAIYELAMDIGQKIAESLGLVGDNFFKEWPCQFRINKYNFKPETIGTTGVQLHTDSGMLTILQEDEDVDGLEIMDKSGQYVPVHRCAGTLLVNLGDIATVWSNGRFYNVKHRVQCLEASTRVSIATFLMAPKEENVEAPADLVDDSEFPRLFIPFTFEEYKKLRVSNKLQTGEVLDLFRTH